MLYRVHLAISAFNMLITSDIISTVYLQKVSSVIIYHIPPHIWHNWPEVISRWTSQVLRSPPRLGWPLWNISVTNDHGCSTCRKHFPVLSSFTTYYRNCLPFGAPEFTPGFSVVRVAQSLVLYIIVCPFAHFMLAIVLSVLLRYTEYDYPFGIFKLVLLF